jgi:hypothetical protein
MEAALCEKRTCEAVDGSEVKYLVDFHRHRCSRLIHGRVLTDAVAGCSLGVSRFCGCVETTG